MRHCFGMEQTPGQRLQTARKVAGLRTQQALADLIGVSEKTIRNYETGVTPIPPDKLVALRKVLGEFDVDGDPVEVAIRRSDLVQWRQTRVISAYQEQLDQQRREATA